MIFLNCICSPSSFVSYWITHINFYIYTLCVDAQRTLMSCTLSWHTFFSLRYDSMSEPYAWIYIFMLQNSQCEITHIKMLFSNHMWNTTSNQVDTIHLSIRNFKMTFYFTLSLFFPVLYSYRTNLFQPWSSDSQVLFIALFFLSVQSYCTNFLYFPCMLCDIHL